MVTLQKASPTLSKACPGALRQREVDETQNRHQNSRARRIALLTRAAFEQDRAARSASIAGEPLYLVEEVFSRPPGATGSRGTNGSAAAASDRRKGALRLGGACQRRGRPC